MRRAVTPALPPKMYRHFAVVTVALTAGLAMFADGERSEVEAAPTIRQAPAAPEPVLHQAPQSASSSSDDWGAEGFVGEFGSPMEVLGSADSSVIPEMSEIAAPEYRPGQVASLGEAERRLLLQGLREKGLPAPGARNQ